MPLHRKYTSMFDHDELDEAGAQADASAASALDARREIVELERRFRQLRMERRTANGAASEEADAERELQPECSEMLQSTLRNAAVCSGMLHPNEEEEPKTPKTNDLQESDAAECSEMLQNVAVSENSPAPESYFSKVSPRKQAAIRHLIEGASISETARRIQVHRMTVSRWINHGFEFEMALREKLREVWSETCLGMPAYARKAVNKLAELLDSNNIPYRMNAARSILALTPLARGRSPVGPYLPGGPE